MVKNLTDKNLIDHFEHYRKMCADNDKRIKNSGEDEETNLILIFSSIKMIDIADELKNRGYTISKKGEVTKP